MTFRLVLVSLAAVLVMSASTTLTFSDTTGVNMLGTVSYAGGASSLVGTKIALGELIVNGAPLNNGVYALDGTIACGNSATGIGSDGTCGSLDFSTGAGLQAGSVPGLANNFAGGGSITIVGTLVDHLGATIASGTLASGSFNSANATAASTSGIGIDSKDAAMLAFFGITNPNFTFAHVTLDIGSINPTAAFSSTVNTASFQNTETPEPKWVGALLLVGLMAGLFATRRFRAQQS
jgi:hypothetical protein